MSDVGPNGGTIVSETFMDAAGKLVSRDDPTLAQIEVHERLPDGSVERTYLRLG